ncbi:hypothetical protein ACMA1I_07040 [Pontibacter sp. 13R65]|uniref:hypothetical protein n=1 Tax=Pontibacter sp. 13R65 TaxID=3127458 RepID=UPI00301D8992
MPTTLPDIWLLLLLTASYLLLLLAVYRAVNGQDDQADQIRKISAAQVAVAFASLGTLYFSKAAIAGFLLSLALLLLLCFVILIYLDARIKK